MSSPCPASPLLDSESFHQCTRQLYLAGLASEVLQIHQVLIVGEVKEHKETVNAGTAAQSPGQNTCLPCQETETLTVARASLMMLLSTVHI